MTKLENGITDTADVREAICEYLRKYKQMRGLNPINIVIQDIKDELDSDDALQELYNKVKEL